MNCVYRASTVEEADIVVAWLADREIFAFVKDRNMAGNHVTLAVAPKGVEVCVADPTLAAQASELLRIHREGQMGQPMGEFEKVVPVQCPKCGSMLEYPGEFMGSEQACPNCGQDIRVGDSPHYC